MATNTRPHMDRQTFLNYLRQSGLLAPEQYAAVAATVPPTDRGRVVARALVEQGLLTRFQAELLLAGRTNGFVLGQYRILDQLGRGGMGRVFKAQHQTMNRTVALKMIANHLVNTERAQQLFQREVRAAARLVHPNIVTAFDANQAGDRHYLVMEYVDGPNLEELVRERGPLPVGQACDFVRQVALGLQHAFEMGMVHRDIKPSNLLLQSTYHAATVKILDFGLARFHDHGPPGSADPPSKDSIVTAENVVVGTPDYLSPEQARNLNQADIRSDLYSLGCTFYFLLAGKVPFPDGTTLEKLVRQSTEQPVPVEQLRPDVPPQVASIVRRMMAKDPALRFQTPAELAAALVPHAVRTPGPGAGPSSDRRVPPAATTPPSAAGKPVAAPPLDADDECALIGTLPMDLSPTPVSTTGLPSMGLRRAVEHEQERRLKIALMIAMAISGVLMLFVGLFMLMS